MNILTDILSLIRRKQYVTQALPEDVIVLGVHTEPEIEGIASPVPYKNVKLIKIKDFVEQNECLPINVPIGDDAAGVFRDKTIDPLTNECYINFRKLKSLSLNLIINESLDNDFVEFNCLAELNTASNVGGGVEVFLQKVGEDLEFRTFTSLDGSVTITEDAETIDLSAGGASFGVWSLVDTFGEKTFYALYNDALLASNPGDTITLHTNIDISVGTGLSLANDVNINLNGFTYTYSNTDTSDAMTDVLSASPVKMRIYNGEVIRKSSAVTGLENDTAALALHSDGRIECENVIFTNEDGWACYVNIGKLINGVYVGSEGGISGGFQYNLYGCSGKGGNEPGIKTTGGSKNSTVIKCYGKSNLSNGISLNGVDPVLDCIGEAEDTEKAGLFLEGCVSQDIVGYSLLGAGIIIQHGHVNGAEGRTGASVDAPYIFFPNAGITLWNIQSAQNVSGYASAVGIGIAIVNTGLNITSHILNSSGYSLSGSSIGIGMYIKTDQQDSTLANAIILQNCSASANISSCIILQSPVEPGTSSISLLNCTFNTLSDVGIGIKSVGTNGVIAYSNCSFRIGENSLGIATQGITQAITNTHDNQGNILL